MSTTAASDASSSTVIGSKRKLEGITSDAYDNSSEFNSKRIKTSQHKKKKDKKKKKKKHDKNKKDKKKLKKSKKHKSSTSSDEEDEEQWVEVAVASDSPITADIKNSNNDNNDTNEEETATNNNATSSSRQDWMMAPPKRNKPKEVNKDDDNEEDDAEVDVAKKNELNPFLNPNVKRDEKLKLKTVGDGGRRWKAKQERLNRASTNDDGNSNSDPSLQDRWGKSLSDILRSKMLKPGESRHSHADDNGDGDGDKRYRRSSDRDRYRDGESRRSRDSSYDSRDRRTGDRSYDRRSRRGDNDTNHNNSSSSSSRDTTRRPSWRKYDRDDNRSDDNNDNKKRATSPSEHRKAAKVHRHMKSMNRLGSISFEKGQSSREVDNDEDMLYASSSSSSSSSSGSKPLLSGYSKLEQLVSQSSTADTNDNPIPSHLMPTMSQEEISKQIKRLKAQALKAKLKKDKDTFNSLMEKIEELEEQKSTTIVKVVTALDAHGRPISLKQSNSNNNNSANAKIFDSKSGERLRYYEDDDEQQDINSLVAAERNSNNDYNANYANYIIKKGSKYKQPKDMEDESQYNYKMFEQKKSNKHNDQEKQRQNIIRAHNSFSKIIDNCTFCFDSPKLQKHLIISLGQKVYISVPEREPMVMGHCFIVPTDHVITFASADEDVIEEVKLFKKYLIKMFATQNKEPIFIETVMNLKQQRHTYIECIPIPIDSATEAPMYFQKAISDSGSEWASHKKLINTSNKGIENSIPKQTNFPYFHVEIGSSLGYAHIIEKELKFPRHFGKEVIAGILALDPSQYLRPKKLSYQAQVQLVQLFLKSWKKFDWTKALDKLAS